MTDQSVPFDGTAQEIPDTSTPSTVAWTPEEWRTAWKSKVDAPAPPGSVAQTGNSATVTISHASPAVVAWTGSNLPNGSVVYFTTTGTLPAGLSANTNYYVVNATANTFNVATTPAGAPVNTTSNGSGTHTANNAAHLTNGTPQPVIAVLLSAGNYLVFGNIAFLGGGSLAATVFGVAVSKTTTIPTGNANQGEVAIGGSFGAALTPNMASGPAYFSLTAPSILYLVGYAEFSAGSVSAVGVLDWIRMP